MKIRKEELERNKVFLDKEVLSDIDKLVLWKMANDSPFRYGHKTETLTDIPQRRFTCVLNMDGLESSGLASKLLPMFENIISLFEEPVNLRQVYINSADCATKTLAHNDNYDNGPSVLISMNQEWDRNWGGYTVFFKGMNSDEIVETVCPIPGQVVIFNGSMWHLALPPSMCAPCPRFMMALKLEYIEPKEQTGVQK